MAPAEQGGASEVAVCCLRQYHPLVEMRLQVRPSQDAAVLLMCVPQFVQVSIKGVQQTISRLVDIYTKEDGASDCLQALQISICAVFLTSVNPTDMGLYCCKRHGDYEQALIGFLVLQWALSR